MPRLPVVPPGRLGRSSKKGYTLVFEAGKQGFQIHYRPKSPIVWQDGRPLFWTADVKYRFPELGARISAVRIGETLWYYELSDSSGVARHGKINCPVAKTDRLARVAVAQRLWAIVQAHFRIYPQDGADWQDYFEGPYHGLPVSANRFGENVFGERA